MVKYSTLAKFRPLILRNYKLVRSVANDSIGTKSAYKVLKDEDQKEKVMTNSDYYYWVPHPKNGIFYPQGQERVMQDIPGGAASFEETYWLRSSDGCDKILEEYPFVKDA